MRGAAGGGLGGKRGTPTQRGAPPLSSLSHAESFEKLSSILSVPIAQLVKACQRFCFPKDLEFESWSIQIYFKIIELIGRIS